MIMRFSVRVGKAIIAHEDIIITLETSIFITIYSNVCEYKTSTYKRYCLLVNSVCQFNKIRVFLNVSHCRKNVEYRNLHEKARHKTEWFYEERSTDKLASKLHVIHQGKKDLSVSD